MSYVAGRVGLIPKGEYSATTQYEKLDIVTYNNKGYIAKADNIPVGTLPTDSNYFLESFSIEGYSTTSEIEEMLSEYSTTEEVTDLVNGTKNNPNFQGGVSSNSPQQTEWELDVNELFRAKDISTISLGSYVGNRFSTIDITFENPVGLRIPDFYYIEGIYLCVNGTFVSGSSTYSGSIRLSISATTDNNLEFTYSGGITKLRFTNVVAQCRYDREIPLSNGTVTVSGWDYGERSDYHLGFVYSDRGVGAYNNSVALGKDCYANGNICATIGENLVTSVNNQTVIGKYNIVDTQGKYAFIIGNGTDDANRSNALAIKWNGEIVTSNF